MNQHVFHAVGSGIDGFGLGLSRKSFVSNLDGDEIGGSLGLNRYGPSTFELESHDESDDLLGHDKHHHHHHHHHHDEPEHEEKHQEKGEKFAEEHESSGDKESSKGYKVYIYIRALSLFSLRRNFLEYLQLVESIYIFRELISFLFTCCCFVRADIARVARVRNFN